MQRRSFLAYFTLLICAVALPVEAGSKRAQTNRLTFHIEGSRSDGPKMVFPLPVGGSQRFFRKSPLTFTKELVAYKPFLAKNGSAGATFAFSRGAQTRIMALTNQNQGKWLVAMLNGRPVDAVLINAPVRDGRLVIWEGIKEPEIYAFDKVLPHIGEDRKTWKKRISGYKAARKASEKAAKERQKERNQRAQ